MIINDSNDKIWCFKCGNWILKSTEILVVDKDVYCLKCYTSECQTHLGYYWDLFPCEHYLEYHDKGQCRCIQDVTECHGNEDNCQYLLARICYENDQEEIKGEFK